MTERKELAAARLAAKQENLLRLAQLHSLGFSAREISGRARRGVLFPVYRGVYLWGTPKLSERGHLLAAQWASGEQAFFSHATAAAIDGHGRVNTRGIELTQPAPGGRSNRDRLIVHRTTDALDRREVRVWNGLRVSTFPRLLIERASTATPKQLEELITFGVRKRLFKPHEVEAVLAAHARRPNIAIVRAAIARYRPHPNRKSSFERSFDAEMAGRPNIPPYEKNVYLGIWEIDCWWPEHRLAVELDARDYHAAIEDFDKDRKKDTELILMGARPMRISEFLWEHDRPGVIVDLEAMLGLREPVFIQRRAS